MGAGRKHETRRREIKDFIIHGTASRMSFKVHDGSLCPSSLINVLGMAQADPALKVGFNHS